MNRVLLRGGLCLFLALFGGVGLAHAIELDYDMQPAMPDFIRNPGGTLTANVWVVGAGAERSVPGTFDVSLYEDQPDFRVVHEVSQGTSNPLDWLVPVGTRVNLKPSRLSRSTRSAWSTGRKSSADRLKRTSSSVSVWTLRA